MCLYRGAILLTLPGGEHVSALSWSTGRTSDKHCYRLRCGLQQLAVT